LNAATRDEGSRAACATPGQPVDVVDVVLELEAPTLPAGFEPALWQAIEKLVPWIAQEPQAGIHPVRGVRCADGSLLVAKRTKLVIRMPRSRICAASVLERASLRVAGASVRLGQGTFRRLLAAATLYSPRVVTGDEDETAFVASLERELDRLAIRGRLLCGRRSVLSAREREYPAWSVAVHELAGEDSLVLQRSGLGLLHDLGCGILAPHKTIHTAD
jgi:CRISPR-associated protein Cas6